MATERDRIHARDEAVLARMERNTPANPRDRAATQAAQQWDAAGTPDPHHGYLRAHDIPPDGARQADGHLLFPVTDTTGTVRALWSIGEDGQGRPMPSAHDPDTGQPTSTPSVHGHHVAVRGDLARAGRVYLAVTIHDAITCATALKDLNAAFAASVTPGNLRPAAEAIRQARPDARMVIIGTATDPDTARAAAEAAGAAAVLPQIPPRHQPEPDAAGPAGWSDLRRWLDAEGQDGAATIRAQIAAQLTDAEAPPAKPARAKRRQPAAPGDATGPASDPTPAAAEDAAEDADLAEVQRLAALSLIDYDREREAASKSLRIRTSTLDAMVRTARDERNVATGPAGGRAIDLYDPEPWPHPVQLADLLDEMHATVRRYVICADSAAHIVVLWAAHTHVYARCTHTPRLILTAPAEECAKSLILHVIKDMTPRPMWTENPSQATFYRLADERRPTFYLSEVDEYPPPQLEIVKDINGGWELDGGALRCVGDAHEVRFFSTFVPVALDGINLVHSKKLPRTSIGRSHVIEMQRATTDEAATIAELDRAPHRDKARDIARKLARWARDHGETFAQHRADFPPGIVNRRRDKWRAMLAIAELASPEWRAHALTAMLADEEPTKPDKELELLRDTWAALQALAGKWPGIWTSQLIDYLCAMENSRWEDHNVRNRDPAKRRIRSDQISAMLGPYGIAPQDIKREGKNRNGYRTDAVRDAIARYAPELLDPKARTEPDAAAPSHREVI